MGGAADDTYNGTDTTLTAGDQLNGGAGNDTLAIVSSTASTLGVGVISTGVETIRVTATAATTVNATQFSGVTTVENSGSTADGDVTFSGLSAIPRVLSTASQGDITLSGFAAGVTSGSADSVAITLNGAATTGNAAITANGIETFAVTSTGSGAGNSAAAVNTRVTLTSDALDNVTVTGSAPARLTTTFTGATNLEVASFDASAATGAIDAAITLGGSARGSIAGGSGDDIITLNTTINRNTTVTGGAGSDTLVVAAAGWVDGSTLPQAAANVSGFETLQIAAGGSADLRSFTNNSGFTAFQTQGTATLSGLGTAAVNLTARAAGTVTATRATDSATADTMTVNLADAAGSTYALSVADEETLTINSGGTGTGTNIVSTLTGTDLRSLTITGSNALTVSTLTGGAALATINAGAHTGNSFTINASNSAVAITATGSAGAELTENALVNTITTGIGNDSITGGAFRDSLVGGVGNDTIIGGAGNDSLYGQANNDVIDGGDGNDQIFGDVGNDSLTGGAGDDTIDAASGSDTVVGGDGNDRVYVSSLSDDDSIDGGAGTADRLTAQALSSTTNPVAADYVDVTDSVTARISGVETGYIQATTTLATNGTAATALNLDMTNVTGMSTLWLDLADSDGATTDGTDFVKVTNFGGATVHLSDTNIMEGVTIDGVGQNLTTNLRAYGGGTMTFTGVGALTVSANTLDSATTQAAQANTVGALTANTATSVTVATTSGTNVLNTGLFTVASVTANDANTVALNARNFSLLTVTGDVVAANGLVQNLDIDVGTEATLNIDDGDITLTNSVIRTLTVDVGTDGNLHDGAAGTRVAVAATRALDADIVVSANADLSLDLNMGLPDLLVTMSSGSTWTTGALGRTGEASVVTVTGTGDVAEGTSIALAGSTFTFSASGLNDSDGIVVTANALSGAASLVGSTGSDSITGSAQADTISGGSGADTITGGAGADSLTGGAGADDFVMVAADAGDTITDFLAGTDDIDYNTGLLSIDGAVTAPSGFQAAAAGTAIAVTTTVFELTGVLTAGTAASLVTALGATATNAGIDAGDKILIVNYTSTGAQIWLFTDADGADIAAGELTLLATLTGVTADSLAGGDFI